jgi:chemotaxis protein CheZ
MMTKRRFRIETVQPPVPAAFAQKSGPIEVARGNGGVDRSDDILSEIRALRTLMQPTQEINERALESFRREMQEAQKIKVELDAMYEAIRRTKHEIATLHVAGCNGHELARVTDELDAVVMGTEGATEAILAAAEAIDEAAGNLTAKLKGDDQGIASDIQDKTVAIFEACNFQDLTGQRITKVVNALRFVEERILRMMDIWGGLETFKDIEVDLEHRQGSQALLNGPALDADANIASQDDIDALFS